VCVDVVNSIRHSSMQAAYFFLLTKDEY